VVLFLANVTTTDIGEMFRIKGLVSLRYFDECVRGMVPRKAHVEYAHECPIIYITNIADRNVTGFFEKTLDRVWVPQSKAAILGRELLLVNVEWSQGHDGRKA
jgi:hypothetical protein